MGTDNETLLQIAIERNEIGIDANTHNASQSLADQEFLHITAWDPTVKANRQANNANRPCLEFPKQLKYTKRLSNEVRLNKPGPKISPEDDQADKKTADRIKGLVKQAVKNADFDTVVSQAFENAVESSYGFFRVMTKYVSDDSFEQDIDVQYIPNPNSVVLDPSYQSVCAPRS